MRAIEDRLTVRSAPPTGGWEEGWCVYLDELNLMGQYVGREYAEAARERAIVTFKAVVEAVERAILARLLRGLPADGQALVRAALAEDEVAKAVAADWLAENGQSQGGLLCGG